MNSSPGKTSAVSGATAWYRHLWPWLLMLPPVASVAGGVAMLWLATNTPATLVVEDYARIEAITAARFAADAQAARYGLSAEARIERSNDAQAAVTIRFSDDFPGSSAGSLHIRLRHVTDATLDRDVIALRTDNEFRSRVQLGSGTYFMEIEPPNGDWRLAARLRPADQLVELNAIAAHVPEQSP